MSQFATADDLAARLGLTLSDEESARADTLLTRASGVIKQTVRQEIEAGSSDITIRSVYGERFRLKERPVTSVDAVFLTPPGGAEAVVDASSYYLDNDELVRVTYRLLYPEMTFGTFGRGWLGPNWQLHIQYSHGYDELPDLVVSTCLEMVVRAWTNPASIAQESIGNTSTLYYYAPSRPTGLLLADTEEKALKAFFRRQAGSVTLR